MKIRVAALTLLAAVSAQAEDQPKPKVAVVSFAALSGDVPQRAGQKAASMFSSELRNTGGFEVLDPPAVPAANPTLADLEAARAAFKEARELREKRKFRLAEE